MFTILVVEDEPDLRYIIRRILARDGHEVAEASHGADALAAIHRSLPDLVVTDMMMPVMGGAELIRRLRADPRTAAIPILAATADVVIADGADTVLAKPWKTQQLLDAVRALLTPDTHHPTNQADD